MSMSGAARVEEVEASVWQATGTEGAHNLKQVAAERLAAHRHRRAAAAAHEAELESRTRQHREALRQAQREDQRRGVSMVRDLVKARYERRESYREFLAAEAERAIEQAEAEAEVAARNAHAVTETQMQLLAELQTYNQPEPGPREAAFARAEAEVRGELAHALADIVLGARELMEEAPSLRVMDAAPQRAPAPFEAKAEPAIREVSAAGLTVRLFEDIPAGPMGRAATSARFGAEPVLRSGHAGDSELVEHLDVLDEEIAFRHAPEFPHMEIEAQPIPGNLIEFPRELVAPKRARPRLAEGPLREEAEPQLRIFEVDAVQVAPESEVLDATAVPDWQSMMLDSAAAEMHLPALEVQSQITVPPQTASLERRLMSAAVDGCCILGAWLGAVAAVAELCGPALGGLTRPMLAGVVLGSLGMAAVMFQVLFFSLSDATPGMRYARIGFCTFGDGNPSRKAMRRRIVSTLLAACPLGLGLLWVWMDNDRMGWHDRMSRMYQRAY